MGTSWEERRQRTPVTRLGRIQEPVDRTDPSNHFARGGCEIIHLKTQKVSTGRGQRHSLGGESWITDLKPIWIPLPESRPLLQALCTQLTQAMAKFPLEAAMTPRRRVASGVASLRRRSLLKAPRTL